MPSRGVVHDLVRECIRDVLVTTIPEQAKKAGYARPIDWCRRILLTGDCGPYTRAAAEKYIRRYERVGR